MRALASAGFSTPQIVIRIEFRRVPSLRRLPFRKEDVFICTGDRPLRRRRPDATPARFPRFQASVIDRVERRPWYSSSTRNSLLIKLQVRVRLVKQLGPFGLALCPTLVGLAKTDLRVRKSPPLEKLLFAREFHGPAQTCKVPLGPRAGQGNVSWASRDFWSRREKARLHLLVPVIIISFAFEFPLKPVCFSPGARIILKTWFFVSREPSHGVECFSSVRGIVDILNDGWKDFLCHY